MQPLTNHTAASHEDLVVGVSTADDAGVYRIAPDQALVQTVDFFTPIVDEPYDWGRIAAANALSDVYAMGGRPITALQLVGWPRDTIPFDLLGDVLAGGADVMAESGTTIVGGHSIDDQEPKYGFAVTGLVDPAMMTTNAAGQAGDVLILTKPLGMGVAATALKRQLASSTLRDTAVEVMVALNRSAAEVMVAAGVRCATDVTGYGLLGHLREIIEASGVSARVETGRVPVLDGIADLIDQGVFPGGSVRNLEGVQDVLDAHVSDTWVKVLADAQTSGGLLMAVPPDRADDLELALAEVAPGTRRIGELFAGGGTPRIEVS